MTMTRCLCCAGVYAAVGADGVRVFHACPPLSDAEVIAALGLNVDRTKWTPLESQQFATAPRVRVNARNENVPAAAVLKPLVDAVKTPDAASYWKQVNALLETTIVAPGAGTTPVP